MGTPIEGHVTSRDPPKYPPSRRVESNRIESNRIGRRPHTSSRASRREATTTTMAMTMMATMAMTTRARARAPPVRGTRPTRPMMIHARATTTTTGKAAATTTGKAAATRDVASRATRGAMVAVRASSLDDDVVVVPGDYRVGGALLGVALATGPLFHLWTQSLVHGVLGGFLAFQASRVRFRFTRDALEVVFIEPGADDSTAVGADVESSGDNKLQGGGANSWKYDSITNWEFWWPGFPCLVYFKETQTKSDGQPHFFPIIMDGKMLYEVMLQRLPASANDKPSPSAWSLDLALEQTSIGRQIKENLSEEQLKQVKEMKGFPGLDDK